MFSHWTFAVLTVLSLSAVQSREPYCTSVLCGYVTGNVQDFALVRVPPGPAILESAPRNVCGGASAVGTYSKVCVADAYPTLDCVRAIQVSVTRTGSPYAPATIKMQAFCLNAVSTVSNVWRTAAIQDDDEPQETSPEPTASAEPKDARVADE